MTKDNELLNEFKELIEAVSLEILKEAQMRDVAKDVVTRSYKAEIADALEAISGEVERVKHKLEALDYISEEEIKAVVYDICEKQEALIKDSEEHIKHIVSQNTQELYISTEKLCNEVTTVNEQVTGGMNKVNNELAKSSMAVEKMHKEIKEGLKLNKETLNSKMRKLFFVNYGLIAVIVGLLIYIIARGSYGA